MKLKSSFLELYNSRNANDFPIFTMLIKNARDFFFCIFQYIRASALNDMKNESKNQFENGEARAKTKGFHSTQNKPNKTQTNDEIPQIKERSQKRPKQVV